MISRREALAWICRSALLSVLLGGREMDVIAGVAEKDQMTTPSKIRHFTAANPGYMTLQGTNQYVMGKESVVVIDVALGADSNMDGILEQVEALGARRVEKILLTHIHSDHCGGALALKKRCGAKIGIHESRRGYLGGEDFQYGDGDRIPFDGGELAVIHTPGHESGHCCFYEPADRILFSGDHILGFGTAVIPPPDGDMTQYMRSLEKLLRYRLRLILPGHGPIVGNPDAKIKEYIDHRLMREREVLAALSSGRDSIGAITEAIYIDVARPLLRVAELSVEAHLIKLIQEGRVKREAGRYRLLTGD